MREEAREICDTVSDIESWADKLKVLTEEVQTQQDQVLTVMCFPFFLITLGGERRAVSELALGYQFRNIPKGLVHRYSRQDLHHNQ